MRGATQSILGKQPKAEPISPFEKWVISVTARFDVLFGLSLAAYCTSEDLMEVWNSTQEAKRPAPNAVALRIGHEHGFSKR
jgi:hypothetical protein